LAITFSGEFTTPRNPDEVFDFLSNPNKFGPLLPDFQSMTVQDPTHFTVKVRVGVGNIRGTAEIKMELAEATRPQRAQYKGQGTAVGSQITLSAGFDLSPVDTSTRVAWQGEANIFGKLASMAGGMLEPLGRKNIQKLIDGLQKALAESVPLTAGEVATQVQGLDTPVPEALQPEPARPQEEAVSPVEGPGLSLMNSVPSHEGASVPAPSPEDAQATALVEAPGFSPVNLDPPHEGALAPADNAQGDHGDHNS
jgi:uncharacterized protein